jgi:cell division initiation protein
MEKITVELIAHKEFSISSKGYNQAEVDNFLDDICEEMERMEKEIADLRQKTTAVRPAAPAPAAAGVTEEQERSFREVLEMAMQVKDDTIRKAREDAEAIRAKAETEATERLDGLNEEREVLVKEVADLKAAAADYRTKFEALLQEQKEALEKAAGLF